MKKDMHSYNAVFIYCPVCREPGIGSVTDENNLKELEEFMADSRFSCVRCGNCIEEIIIHGIHNDCSTFLDAGMILPERLYHYTSIETVKLILKNRTIRFSRLDCVNDPLEAYADDYPEKAPEYTFVSCWTYQGNESLLHWGRYTNDIGCRIALPLDMFKGRHGVHLCGYRDIPPHRPGDVSTIRSDKLDDRRNTIRISDPLQINIDKIVFAEHRIRKILQQDYIIGPTYVGYPKGEESIRELVVSNKSSFDMLAMGTLKTAHWKDEKEVRFRIYATEADRDVLSINDWAESPFRDDEYVIDNYIDVPLDYSALNMAVITKGPLTDKNKWNELVEYCSIEYPGIKFNSSEIKIRSKG